MAEDQEPTGPSLEPPSLFRRRKKDAPPPTDDSPTTILDDVAPAAAPPGPKPTSPPLFADEVSAAPAASSDPNVLATAPKPDTNGPLDAPKPARRAPREGPIVSGRVAAAISGLLVGGVIVGLTKASFSLCERLQGTDSCGGPGFFLLVAILILAGLLGSLVLRLCQVAEPGSTSFLAVGLTSVITLLFLVDQIFDWWMLIAIPLVSIATYLLSHWVTSTFVEPARQVGLTDDPEYVDHDVR